MRTVVTLVLMLVANIMWDSLMLFGMYGLLDPGGAAMSYLAAPFLWLLPFIAYLIVLYRKAVFVSWQRVFRALTICIVSFSATQIAVVVSAHIALFLAFKVH